ncbi:MAG TPA: hypothetical protein VN516_07770 [Candidatus Baltobacteraceae bacterium]|nr:hypothetical protein [Candidatus Baltobacteraceae bacterium]
MQDTQAALKIINEMREAGVIGNYAIGGAVAATFYIEPTATYDIDIFISFKNVPKSSIVSLEPIYSYLKSRGYGVKDEHIVIENWQIQFLPADDDLYSEALQQAVEINVGEIKTRVMAAEHLMAIALRTGRGKDLIRLEQFVQDKAFNQTKLDEILTRHNLVAKWKQFYDKYINNK